MKRNDLCPSLHGQAFIQSIMELNIKSGSDFFEELCFSSILEREKKRSSRTGRAMLLVLVNLTALGGATLVHATTQLNSALASRIRETDFQGWYMLDSVVGILFTDLHSAEAQTRESLFAKTLDALTLALKPEDLPKVYVTCRSLPAAVQDAIPTSRVNIGRVSLCIQEGTRYIAFLEKFCTRFCHFLGMNHASPHVVKILGRSKYRVASENAEYEQR